MMSHSIPPSFFHVARFDFSMGDADDLENCSKFVFFFFFFLEHTFVFILSNGNRIKAGNFDPFTQLLFLIPANLSYLFILQRFIMIFIGYIRFKKLH
ncbi:hypothetical protein YC2023_089126 [Brassica napus]